MEIPNYFCWTRFGVEAGQAASDIFIRKENERLSNNGVFLWGIGNSIAPSISAFIETGHQLEVLFSPIKSKPKSQDIDPSSVAVWSKGETIEGDGYQFPKYSIVTSRYNQDKPKRSHFALICYSNLPITYTKTNKKIASGKLRNLLTKRPVGASQVTAIVEHLEEENSFLDYEISIRAKLVYPYFIRLKEPKLLPETLHAERSTNNWLNTAFQLIK